MIWNIVTFENLIKFSICKSIQLQTDKLSKLNNLESIFFMYILIITLISAIVKSILKFYFDSVSIFYRDKHTSAVVEDSATNLLLSILNKNYFIRF